MVGGELGLILTSILVQVGIAGMPADTVMKKTRKIEDDWTPVWDQEFSFPLTVPELALLRVEVHEYDLTEKDDFAGQTCLPVSELKSGIRAIPLHDRKGKKMNSVSLHLILHHLLLFAVQSRCPRCQNPYGLVSIQTRSPAIEHSDGQG